MSNPYAAGGTGASVLASVRGDMVAGIVRDILSLAPKPAITPWRSSFVSLERATAEEWAALVETDPAYGRVICRCRRVSEAQIVNAIHAPLGARSLDAVKRRTEACMRPLPSQAYALSMVIGSSFRDRETPVSICSLSGSLARTLSSSRPMTSVTPPMKPASMPDWCAYTMWFPSRMISQSTGTKSISKKYVLTSTSRFSRVPTFSMTTLPPWLRMHDG